MAKKKEADIIELLIELKPRMSKRAKRHVLFNYGTTDSTLSRYLSGILGADKSKSIAKEIFDACLEALAKETEENIKYLKKQGVLVCEAEGK